MLARVLRTRWPTITLVLFLIGVCYGQDVLSADRELPALEEVVSHLDESLSSLVTVECQYTHRQIPNPDGPVDWEAEGVSTSESSWQWRVDGEKRSAEQTPFQDPVTGNWHRLHVAFDGDRNYDANYDRQNPQQMFQLTISPGPAKVAIFLYRPECWLGLHLPWFEASMVTLVKQPDWQVAGWVDVHGAECLQIEPRNQAAPSARATLRSVFLDPDHDWLPRRFVVAHAWDQSDHDRVETFEVTEFRLVADPLLGRDRWFPILCWSDDSEVIRHELKIETVRVNKPLERNQFQIDPRPGTEVIEITQNNGKRVVRRTLQGGESAAGKVRRKAIEAASEMVATTGNAIEAEPDRGVAAKIGWLIAGACGVAAFLVWRRQQA